jgi:hypothetical protein
MDMHILPIAFVFVFTSLNDNWLPKEKGNNMIIQADILTAKDLKVIQS